MVGSVEDVGVVKLTHRLELLEHTTNLDIDVLAAGELAPQFVADRALVPLLPHSRHGDLVTETRMAMGEGMGRQVVRRQWRLLRVGRRERIAASVIHRTVLGEQFWLSITRVVRVREAEVDQEWILVVSRSPFAQVAQHLPGVPGAAGRVGIAALVALAAHRELRIRRRIAVTGLAGPHRVIAGPVEDGGHRRLGQVGGHEFRIGGVGIALRPQSRLIRDMPHRPARHDHVPRRSTNATGPRAHVMGGVERHTFAGEPIERRRLELGGRIVGSQVERRLVVDDDQEDVGTLGRRRARRQKHSGDPREQHEMRGSVHVPTRLGVRCGERRAEVRRRQRP